MMVKLPWLTYAFFSPLIQFSSVIVQSCKFTSCSLICSSFCHHFISSLISPCFSIFKMRNYFLSSLLLLKCWYHTHAAGMCKVQQVRKEAFISLKWQSSRYLQISMVVHEFFLHRGTNMVEKHAMKTLNTQSIRSLCCCF